MALLLLVLQQIVLVAALALLAQFVVAMFNWNRRQDNIVFQLLGIVAKPFVRLTRLITPRVVVDQHLPAVTFWLLVVGYLGLGLWHRGECLSNLRQPGCERWVEARLEPAR